uniref:Lysine-specific metallo-endopeptidase domain-containing protein n=1 Tax=Amphimedon queenslandica TaxID=400682 RepID=A0A1X7TAI7_AMPQE
MIAYQKCEHYGGPCSAKAIAWTFRSYPFKPYTIIYFCESYYGYPIYCDGDKPTKELIILTLWAQALGYKGQIKEDSNSCQQLAKDDPDKAVENSGSYGYQYCESY